MIKETRAERRRKIREERKLLKQQKVASNDSGTPSAIPLAFALLSLVVACTLIAFGFGGQEFMQLNISSVLGWLSALGLLGWGMIRWVHTRHLYKEGNWRWFFGAFVLGGGVLLGWMWVNVLTLARDNYAHTKITATYPALTHSVAGWTGSAWDEKTCDSLGGMQDKIIDDLWSSPTPPSKISLTYLIKNEAILYQAGCHKRWHHLYDKAKKTHTQASWDRYPSRRAKTVDTLNKIWPNMQAGCLMEVQRSKTQGITLFAICESPIPSEEAWLPLE